MVTSWPNGDVDKANLAGLQRGCSRPTGRCKAWPATDTRPSAGLINCQWMLPAIAARCCCWCSCWCWCGRVMRVDVQRHTWRIRDIWAMFSRLMCDILFVFRQLANNVWQPPAATSWMSTEGESGADRKILALHKAQRTYNDESATPHRQPDRQTDDRQRCQMTCVNLS